MFNPSQEDVRNFFFNVYKKYKSSIALEDIEKIAVSTILEHPEYDIYLSNPDKYIDYKWLPEEGHTNPFLHLSMHMSILEQLSIDQPLGIKNLYTQLCTKFGGEHNAQHELMDCIAEMIWSAQHNNLPPDINIYFECINHKLSKT